ALIGAYYGRQPQHSYFAACSNGGRQALMEAQRYPEDYDGILAGAPANSWTHLLTNALANSQALAAEGAYIPASKLPAIAQAVNAACDAQDGVADGVLNDPRQCHLSLSSVLQCKDGDSNQCLTTAQVATLQKLYEGAHGADGRLIFPGY